MQLAYRHDERPGESYEARKKIDLVIITNQFITNSLPLFSSFRSEISHVGTIGCIGYRPLVRFGIGLWFWSNRHRHQIWHQPGDVRRALISLSSGVTADPGSVCNWPTKLLDARINIYLSHSMICNKYQKGKGKGKGKTKSKQGGSTSHKDV